MIPLPYFRNNPDPRLPPFGDGFALRECIELIGHDDPQI